MHAGYSISETSEYFYQKVYEGNNYQTIVSFEETLFSSILQRFNNLVFSLYLACIFKFLRILIKLS